jgi:hypothetical protein
MKKLCEGNLYNIETEISHISNPTPVGIEQWKKEIRKQLLKALLKKNIKDLNPIVKKVFGNTID